MRYELHNRDGKCLGLVELDEGVQPIELMQDLQHTAVVLGPAVCDVDDGPATAPVAVAVAPKARRRTKRGNS